MNVVLFISTDLSEVSSSPTLHQRNVCGQTHPVYVVPGLPVVQSVHHDVELFEPVPVVLVLHNGPVQGLNGTLGSEPTKQNNVKTNISWFFISNLRAASLAQADLDFPTCCFWNRNCRFRLETSMVSKSMMTMSLKPG